jgi:hypothetical protein
MKKTFLVLLLISSCCYAQIVHAQNITKSQMDNVYMKTINTSIANSLANAKAYADKKDSIVLSAAKKYTDDIRVAITGDYMKRFSAIPQFDSAFTTLPGVRLVKLANNKFDIQVQVYYDPSCKCYKLNWQ